jgi:hypothetical protein
MDHNLEYGDLIPWPVRLKMAALAGGKSRGMSFGASIVLKWVSPSFTNDFRPDQPVVGDVVLVNRPSERKGGFECE